MNHCITLVNSLVDLTPVQPRPNGNLTLLPFSFPSKINKKNNLQLDIANPSSLNTNQKVTT